MNELTVFKNEEFGQVRTILIDNEPWIVLNDICKVLEISNPWNAASRIDEDDLRKADVIDSMGRKQLTNVVNESGFYATVLQSKKPKVKKFKKWVTSDILPAIRKQGVYMTPEAIEKTIINPDFIIKLATSYKNEQELNKKLQSQIESNRSKVLFADSVANSKTLILIREQAKILTQNGVKIGEKQLYKWLREHGYLIKKEGDDYNTPTQRAAKIGLFHVIKTAIIRSNGNSTIAKTTKVTPKGQEYFVNRFLNKERIRENGERKWNTSKN